MKVLIIYSSKYGFTERCVEYLKEGLNAEVISKNIHVYKHINFSEYDWIILGSSVYVGKINKKLKKFTEKNMEALLKKNIALFACCTTPSEVDNYLSEGFSKKIYDSSSFNANFGGKLQREKLNLFERKLTDIVSKSTEKQQGAIYENMDSMISLINKSSN